MEGQRIPAHKVILAASSDYFRALLYGGMRESNQVINKSKILNYIVISDGKISQEKTNTKLDNTENFVRSRNKIWGPTTLFKTILL